MIDIEACDRVAIKSVFCQSPIHYMLLEISLPRGISCDPIEALQSGVSTFAFDSLKRFGRASLPDDFWVRFIRSTSFFPRNLVEKSGCG